MRFKCGRIAICRINGSAVEQDLAAYLILDADRFFRGVYHALVIMTEE